MSDSSAERTRSFSWQDPNLSAKVATTMSGLEFLQAIARGEIPPPPVMEMMNVEFGAAEAGKVSFAMVPAEYHYNPIGTVHGGVATTLCDSAMGCAVQSMLPAGTAYTTLELKINFVRPITVATGRILCEGSVIHVGSRVATAESRITDANGKLYVHATTTCLIMPLR